MSQPINDCPFCGAPDTYWDGYCVQCDSCGASGPGDMEEYKAITVWNGPTDDIDRLRADCDRLRRELDDCNGVIR